MLNSQNRNIASAPLAQVMAVPLNRFDAPGALFQWLYVPAVSNSRREGKSRRSGANSLGVFRGPQIEPKRSELSRTPCFCEHSKKVVNLIALPLPDLQHLDMKFGFEKVPLDDDESLLPEKKNDHALRSRLEKTTIHHSYCLFSFITGLIIAGFIGVRLGHYLGRYQTMLWCKIRSDNSYGHH
jgi:hypothetical protein